MLDSKSYQIFAAINFRNGKNIFFAGVFFLLSLSLTTLPAKADVVNDWNEIAAAVVLTNANRSPGAAVVDMAYVHAAIYDAVNAIDGRYTPYTVALADVPKNASKEAAAATAAYHVLKTLFPDQTAFLEAKYLQYLQNIPESEAKTKGVEIGKEVAVRFMSLRANDGRDAVVAFNQTTGSSAWQATPPAYAPAQTPWMALMRPFMMQSPSQFRAEGPPSMTSEQWTRDYNETKNYGSLNSTARTPAQTEIGRFYAEHAGAQYSRVIRNFAAGQNLSVADNSRLFAMLYLAMADALVAAWDSKYYFAYWRPVTAIRAGNTDGNDSTEADPSWTPLVATPGHPEYPAAHGCLTTAFAETLRAFYGTKKVKITLSSTVTNTTRTFDNTDDLIKEIIDARIFGGMHFRTSGVHGTIIGKKVVKLMTKHYFQPVQ